MTEEHPDAPVIRDKRLVDPVTGEVRQPAGAPHTGVSDLTDAVAAETAAAEVVDADLTALERELTERTADIQRVHAEYANYRKRVERDRELVRDQATASVLAELLTVLDDIDRAREHDELVGGFKSVAEALEAAVGKLGLVRFGTEGEPFDPMRHEAMTHALSPDVDASICSAVYQPGYEYAGRVVRPARVAVTEPE